MIITSSSVSLAAAHSYEERHETEEHLQFWQNNGQVRQAQTAENGLRQRAQSIIDTRSEKNTSDLVDISSKAVEQPRYVRGYAESITDDESIISDLKIMILRALIERLTGKKIDIVDPGELSQASDEGDSASASTAAVSGGSGEQTAGWGVIYDYHERSYEHEQTIVNGQGVVVTSDGVEINFQLSISMSREFYSENNISLRAGDALKDPLVINFQGTAAELTEDTFNFDIDSDGTSDQIHFVSSNSGFLAYDRDNSGVIENGKELFGATTGNGFAELSEFDQDGNNWIDENDAIFDKLRIWTRDEAGNQQLLALGQKGVGAIYLGHVASPFSLKDADNELTGQVRSTGVVISENGQAGTIQQIDLVA